jgi:hypothetical protein
MRLSVLRVVTAIGGLLVCAAPLNAQGYHVRWDTWFQSAAFRGVTLDSVSADLTTVDGTGGTIWNGLAVKCGAGAAYCTYFTPGEERRGAPLTSTVNASLWGFGITGLKLHLKGRVSTDFENSGLPADASGPVWPGTEPAAQLLEGYAEYSSPFLTLQAGRTHVFSRLGFWGFDGAQATVRPLGGTLKVSGYGGWALAEGAVLPVTSDVLNPLEDYRPADREVIVGGTAGWNLTGFEGRFIYQRLIDPDVNRPTSDLGAVEATVYPGSGFSVAGGVEYNFGEGELGTYNLQLAYQDPGNWIRLVVGDRRYRPNFPLWSIWGVFSPAGYNTLFGSVAVYPVPGLELRTRGETYSYDDDDGASPLVDVEDSGWRGSLGGTYTGFRGVVLDASYHAQFGPGASSQGLTGRVTVDPLPTLSVTAHGGYLDRPLEYRFGDSEVWSYGARLDVHPMPGIVANVGMIRYDEVRDRPSGGLDWDHWRFSAGLTLMFGSSGNRVSGLHPSILRIPETRGSR